MTSPSCPTCGESIAAGESCHHCQDDATIPPAQSLSNVASVVELLPDSATDAGGGGPAFPSSPPLDSRPRPAMEAAIPDSLRKLFEPLSILGKGGMGIVYRARDVRSGREVAVKVVLDQSPKLVALFRQEARVLARLEHDNVVRLYETGVVDEVPYLVMELVRGQSLSARLASGRPSLIEAVRLGRDIVSGLTAAHELSIAHFDLKPANVFLETTGRAKVADFGLARPVSKDVEGLFANLPDGGSPGYVSPEHFSGQAGFRDVSAGRCHCTAPRARAAVENSSPQQAARAGRPRPPARPPQAQGHRVRRSHRRTALRGSPRLRRRERGWPSPRRPRRPAPPSRRIAGSRVWSRCPRPSRMSDTTAVYSRAAARSGPATPWRSAVIGCRLAERGSSSVSPVRP